MAHDGKIAAVTQFVTGVEKIKAAIRDDCKAMIAALPVEVLSDETQLAAFLEEMMQAAIEKHVLTPDRKIRPEAAALINGYVSEMLK